MFVKQIKNFAAEVVAAVASRLLPSGGSATQVLAKTSGTDYAVGWVNAASSGNMNRNFSSGTGGTSIGAGETSIGTVTITPQSASSAILIIARLVITKDANTTVRTVTARVKRDSTQIGLDCEIRSQGVASSRYGPAVITAIDSTHGTTSAITYTLYALCSSASASTSDDWEIIVVELMGAQGANGNNGTNGFNADMTRSSNTSNVIGTGSKTFTYTSSSNLGWAVGTRLRVANSATNWMEGVVTAVSSTSVTITADLTNGSGTLASWTITIAGERGLSASTHIFDVDSGEVVNTTTETTLGSFVVSSWNLSRPIKLKFYCEWYPDTSSSTRSGYVIVYIGANDVARISFTNQSLLGGLSNIELLVDVTIMPLNNTEGYALVSAFASSSGDSSGIIPINIGTNGDGHGECIFPPLSSAQTVYIKGALDFADPNNSLYLRAHTFDN